MVAFVARSDAEADADTDDTGDDGTGGCLRFERKDVVTEGFDEVVMVAELAEPPVVALLMTSIAPSLCDCIDSRMAKRLTAASSTISPLRPSQKWGMGVALEEIEDTSAGAEDEDDDAGDATALNRAAIL